MKKILLSAALICTSLLANAQCTAVANLDENFDNFTASFPQNCWTASVNAPMVSVDPETAGGKSVTLYSFFSANTAFYLVTPELSTIGGQNVLSFDAGNLGGNPGTYTIQPGTMATATDFANFQAAGQPITVTATMISYTNIAISAAPTQKFIAFKVLATNQHMAATLDNVKWQPALGVNESNLTAFKVYPNPSLDKKVTISYNENAFSNDKNTATVYNLAGAKVFETQMQESTQTLNLSELASGVYILKLNAGNTITTKKLVLK